MNIDSTKLFPGIPGIAKVWIYQADREFESGEREWIKHQLEQFVSEWKAHGSDLAAAAEIIADRFIILAVDEAQALASGCSIDSSVRKIREIGQKLGVDLLDRSRIAYEKNGEIHLVPFSQMKDKYASSEITDETPIYNNSIQNLGELRNGWIVKLKESPAMILVK